MQIVIDIPENVYKWLKQEWVKIPEDDSIINQIMHGILHGTVLPKGHGDLISRSALKDVFSDWHNWHTVIGYGKVVFLDKLLEKIDNAETIIEADTEAER